MSKFNIELTEQELQTVAAAVSELPFRVAEPLMRNLQEQVNAQQANPQFEEMPEGAQVN